MTDLKNWFWVYLLAFLLIVGLKECRRHDDTVLADKTSVVLKENEVGKVIIRRRSTTLVRPTASGYGRGSDAQTTVPVYGRLSVLTVKQDPRTKETTLETWQATHGFVVEPAIALAYSDRFRAGVDVQLFYWRNWGIDVGLVSDRKFNSFRLYCGPSYRVYNNTSVFVGEDSRRSAMFGVKTEF